MSSKRMRHAKRMGKAYGKRYWDEMSQEAFVECFVPTFVWPVVEAAAEPEPPTTVLRMFVRETVDAEDGQTFVDGRRVRFVRKIRETVAAWNGPCPCPKPYNHPADLCPAAKRRMGRFAPKAEAVLAVPDGKGGFVDPTDNVPVVVMESPFGEQIPAPYGCGAPLL